MVLTQDLLCLMKGCRVAYSWPRGNRVQGVTGYVGENESKDLRWERGIMDWVNDADSRLEAFRIADSINWREPGVAKMLRSDAYARKRGWL